MRRTTIYAVWMLIIYLLLSPAMPVIAGPAEESTVQSAISVMNEAMEIPEDAIPTNLLNNAYGIAIFPELVKAGFIVGGRYGNGVLLLKQENQTWSNPVFFRLTGGSIGWQIGAQLSDVILVFMNKRSLDSIASGQFTLGANASLAAGPVGRNAEASTDVMLRAEILSYSRTRGLFAGVSLEGAAVQVDYGATSAFYNVPGILPVEVFRNSFIAAPRVSAELKNLLAQYCRM